MQNKYAGGLLRHLGPDVLVWSGEPKLTVVL